MNARFCVIQDPCGVYFIWDDLKLEPVIENGEVLAFATEPEANWSVAILNGRDTTPPKTSSTITRRFAAVTMRFQSSRTMSAPGTPIPHRLPSFRIAELDKLAELGRPVAWATDA